MGFSSLDTVETDTTMLHSVSTPHCLAWAPLPEPRFHLSEKRGVLCTHPCEVLLKINRPPWAPSCTPELFNRCWLSWASVPRSEYLDPVGEYTPGLANGHSMGIAVGAVPNTKGSGRRAELRDKQTPSPGLPIRGSVPHKPAPRLMMQPLYLWAHPTPCCGQRRKHRRKVGCLRSENKELWAQGCCRRTS